MLNYKKFAHRIVCICRLSMCLAIFVFYTPAIGAIGTIGKEPIEMNYAFSKSEDDSKIRLKISFVGKNCEVLKSGKCFMILLAYKSNYDPSSYSPDTLENAIVNGAIEKEVSIISKEQMLEIYSAKS